MNVIKQTHSHRQLIAVTKVRWYEKDGAKQRQKNKK
jgi:hypothetical protein